MTTNPPATAWVLPGYMDSSIERMLCAYGFNAFVSYHRPKNTPDFIVFCGGADVNPTVYRKPNEGSVGCDDRRDAFEVKVYEEYRGKSSMIGICRGAQLLNVLNGGEMIQDLPHHHGGTRPIITTDGKTMMTEECHHQGMIANPENGVVLATDPEHGNHEVVWYKDTASFCFQAHPEYGHGTTRVFFELLEGAFA